MSESNWIYCDSTGVWYSEPMCECDECELCEGIPIASDVFIGRLEPNEAGMSEAIGACGHALLAVSVLALVMAWLFS